MRALRIPDRYAGGLGKIKALTDSQVEQISRSLADVPTSTQREMAALIAPTLPDFSHEDIKALVEALRSLYSARSVYDVAMNEFISAIVAAVRRSDRKELRTTDKRELARLENTLTKLLGIRSLLMALKVRDLQAEQENIFCGARTVTDMRPVFDDVKASPTGFVLFHTLKLEYHRHGEHTDIRIALDNEDVESLIAVLRRAQDKAVTLSGLSKEHHLPLLEE